MKRWMTTRRVVTLGLAGAALTAGIAGPSTAALAAPPDLAAPADDAGAADPGGATLTATPAESKALDYQFQLQRTGSYCGPAATRVALTAQGLFFTQAQIAEQLHTTNAGTNSIADVTTELNHELGDGTYFSVMIPGRAADVEQTATFKADVVTAVDAGDAPVVNIVGTATDTSGYRRTYANGHYLAIVGYANYGDTVLVADSAGKGATRYAMSTVAMADWIAGRGYAA